MRWLWEVHGAKKLDVVVKDRTTLKPRNVTATREEVDLLMACSKPSMKLFLLLCSDLAMRSGTVNKINGSNYDRERREFRFTTKGGSIQMLPVTEEIARIIDPLDQTSKVPFVWQLREKEAAQGKRVAWNYGRDVLYKELREMEKELGFTRRIIPHDLRRTTAVAMLRETHDLRAVKALLGHDDLKSTLWYIDHDNTPVELDTLEKIKRPFIVRKERTA